MRILFQGDSITDSGRNGNSGCFHQMGQGYALMVAGQLGLREPGAHTFVNRGISGNRIVDVFARIKADGWNVEPDVFSLLIGVNDVWHELGSGNGVSAERFERVYRMLIEDTLEALPAVRFMLLEPFLLRCGSAEEHWDLFREEVALRSEVTERMAAEYGQVFVPLQQKLDRACTQAPADYWLADGVHPTAAGHRLIADAWLEAFDRYIG